MQLRIADLYDAGIRRDAIPMVEKSGWMRLASHREIQYFYDSNQLLLEISVPASWLTPQRLGQRPDAATTTAISSNGLLLNYDAYLTHVSEQRSSVALWTEQRALFDSGVLTNTGTFRRLFNRDSEQSRFGHHGYVRYDTQWGMYRESDLLGLTVGDLVTGAQAWSTPVRMGGVKLARDFRLRPDLITYPLPEFSGQAAIPTTVDLFVNGYRTRTERVQPGPFTLTDLPFISGAGEATIVTTDAVGRQIATTMPFYVSNDLLRKGLTDYSASLGALRRDYGIDSFAYGSLAAASSLRAGVTDQITLENQIELASTHNTGSLALMGVGGVFDVAMHGMINAAISRSAYRGMQGWQQSFGYRYARGGFNIGYQGARSTKAFRNLASIEPNGSAPSQHSDVLTTSISGAPGMLGAGYVDLRTADESRLRLLNLSVTRQLKDGINFYLSFNRDIQRNQSSVAAQLFVALGRGEHVLLGGQHDGHISGYTSYTHSAPAQGGIGTDLGYAHSDDGGLQLDAAMAWNTAYSRVEGGFSRAADQRMEWASMRGALIMMDDKLFATREVSDAFVLVSTDGVADVPVRYENQLVGRTDHDGYLLVPWVTSHYAAKYEIDALELPLELRVTEVEQRVTLRRASGTVLRFAMQPITAAVISLRDVSGAAIPSGSVATELLSNQQAIVGFDGLVYFEDLSMQNDLVISRPDGSHCQARFQLSNTGQVAHVGPLICE